MFADMPLKMAVESFHREMVSFVFHACAIIINEGWLQHGNKGIVASASLNHSLMYINTSNMPWLSSFKQIELIESTALERAFVQSSVSVIHVQ